MITMTTAEPTSLPVRILNKGPDFFRPSSTSSQGSDARRKTAAERLEEDKLKYVKSAKVRQRRATTEIFANLATDFGATRPGTACGGSPVTKDDDDVTMRGKTENVKTRRKVNRSNTDVDASSRLRVLNSGGLRKKNDQGKVRGDPSPDGRSRRSYSPKDGKSGRSFSSYLNKAKEGLKAVTSSIAGVHDDDDVNKTRRSRSTAVKSSKYRSSSVGASQFRVDKVTPSGGEKQVIPPPDAKAGMVSPRTQLKQARQKLKKVNSSKSDDAKAFSPTRNRGKTFTVVPRLNDENREADAIVRRRSMSIESTTSPRPVGRPLAVIENKSTQNALGKSPGVEESTKREQMNEFTKRRTSSSSKEVDIQKDVIIEDRTSGSASARLGFSQRSKRMSWDVVKSSENNLQPAQSKPAAQTVAPDPEMVQATLLSSLPQSQKRKSWSRVPPSTSELRKNSSRKSFSEDSSHNRPGTRKSITEALEEIFNPLEDDDMDTAYHSMSPDASMDCKTMTTPNSYGEKSSTTIVAGANSWLRDVRQADLSRSKTPESARSKTPVAGDEGISFEAVDGGSSRMRKSSHQSSPESIGRRSNRVEQERQWVNANDVTATSQPLNRIDLAPNQNAKGGITDSPMMAPKSRREVAPDYSISKPSILGRSSSREDHLNTLKSQNTSSSASEDVNKPFTALTASDLKPRRPKRGSATQQLLPIKPVCPYPPVSNYRGNAKRHNNTPVSPTLSPNKQAARMTPPHGSKSSSSTPYSSLKRTPTSSRSSSLKRNRQRSMSDLGVVQSELDRFFSSMGMNEVVSPLRGSRDTLFTTAFGGSESDFSFAGASAYVRDGLDDMEVDPSTAGLANAPSVSIIEKNARVMRWLAACKKNIPPPAPVSPLTQKPPQSYKPPVLNRAPSFPPPIPPRLSSYKAVVSSLPKESDV